MKRIHAKNINVHLLFLKFKTLDIFIILNIIIKINQTIIKFVNYYIYI